MTSYQALSAEELALEFHRWVATHEQDCVAIHRGCSSQRTTSYSRTVYHLTALLGCLYNQDIEMAYEKLHFLMDLMHWGAEDMISCEALLPLYDLISERWNLHIEHMEKQ